MRPEIPHDLIGQIATWDDLHRWERRILGIELRKLGLTYTEIRELIPVPKSTLSNWCSGVVLQPSQIERIQLTSSSSRLDVPTDTQWRRRAEIAAIRGQAREFAFLNVWDPWFVLGVTLYWGEGAKSKNYLDLVNSDPRALTAFTAWVRRYLDEEAEFVLALHLHEGNDEDAAKRYWRSALDMPTVPFTKTFIKPRGTGHRKNHLEHGVCRVRTRNASDHWNRVMEWIDVVADLFGCYEARIASIADGSLAQFGRASDS